LDCYRKTIDRRFPKLLSLFASVPDPRNRKKYRIEEILMGSLSMFMLKESSRNSINHRREEGYFTAHYQQLFGVRLPHQDSIAEVLSELPNEKLEELKVALMSKLIEQKCLRKYRLLDKYYMVAVDATGIVSYDYRHCPHCLTRKSKNGKTSYFHYVLEAKLVTNEGHALSLASEWIENPAGEFNKQDCERKAFVRLAAKLKKYYPRLPICILADGLYPYENAFKICELNDWKYIIVLQEDSLKSVQEELRLTRRQKSYANYYQLKKGWRISDAYRYQEDILYHEKYTLHWVECNEERREAPKLGKKVHSEPQNSHFEYLTNIKPDQKNVRALASGGRLRWKVENEGFNTQKNGDYELEHKYCRNSHTAMQNYYTLLQIAHAINQWVEKGKTVRAILKERPKETIHNLWFKLKAYMIFVPPPQDRVPIKRNVATQPAPD
jgi:hypothetical protein